MQRPISCQVRTSCILLRGLFTSPSTGVLEHLCYPRRATSQKAGAGTIPASWGQLGAGSSQALLADNARLTGPLPSATLSQTPNSKDGPLAEYPRYSLLACAPATRVHAGPNVIIFDTRNTTVCGTLLVVVHVHALGWC